MRDISKDGFEGDHWTNHCLLDYSIGFGKNFAGIDGMYIKGVDVRIKRKVSDLHDVTVDSKKVVLF